MSDLKIAVPGAVYQTELSTTQIAITNAANALSLAVSNNIATLTFASAHGLTAAPAAGTLPNFYFTFAAATVTGGTGTLNGPIFQILSIPSTTTLTFYTTVTSATFSGASVIPVFIPVYSAFTGSAFSGYINSYSPVTSSVIQTPLPILSTANCNFTTGPNCLVAYYPDNTSIIQTPISVNVVSGVAQPPGQTLVTAPTQRTLLPASSQGQVWLDGTASIAVLASGTAGTSRVSVIS